MTDINLKTLTPAALPPTGFLFGADSQAVGTTSPSVYSTQAVATTLLGSTSLTGGPALTADAPVLNLTQTWSNNAVTFTGIRYNVTNTNSAAASLLMDLQVGGVSQFKVGKTGTFTFDNNGHPLSLIPSPASLVLGACNLAMSDGWAINWNDDVFLNRKATANLRLGKLDAASPVAQTLSVQSVVSGTAGNVAGANLTITGSQGVGSGAGGSIVFQVAPAGSTATFTVTFTNGSATINGTGLPTTAGTAVAFTTTGALPTNFAINTTYFVLAGSTSTAITVAATAGGTAIVAGSAGSGTQTLTQAVAQNGLVNALTIDSTKTIIQNGAGYNWYYNTTSNQELSIQPNNVNVGFAITADGVRVCSAAPFIGFASGVNGLGTAFLSRAATGVLQVGTTSNNASGTLKAAVIGTTTAYTVATLPTGFQGARAYVTDATLPTYLGALTGGGAVVCPVFYDGTAWVSA